MKLILPLAVSSIVLLSPCALGGSELEALRQRCAEQERQIRLLEEENAKLRPDGQATERTTPEKKPTPVQAEPVKEAPKAAPIAKAVTRTYKVKAGDNIHKIARSVGTKPETLARVNGLKTNSIIQIGQMLKLPARPTDSKPAAKQTEPAQAAATKPIEKPVAASKPESKVAAVAPATTMIANSTAPAEPAPAPQAAPARKIKPIIVDGEMTYGEFATKHETDTERLNALNGLDLTTSTVLAKGSELYVPTKN